MSRHADPLPGPWWAPARRGEVVAGAEAPTWITTGLGGNVASSSRLQASTSRTTPGRRTSITPNTSRATLPNAIPDLDTLLAENAKLHGDLDAIAIAMGLANEHEGHVQRADIERLCEDALAARRAEAMLADVQSENAKLRAVAEAARDLAECDAHGEFCDVPILAEKRGRARGRDDSDDWNEAECDCCAGRARKALLAALEAP